MMLKKIFFAVFSLIFSIKGSHVLAMTSINEDEAVVHIRRPTSSNWGHVSLETQNYYMSLWPLDKKKMKAQQGVLVTSLLTDCSADAEGRPSDANYTLSSSTLGYSLSVPKINKAFENFLSYNGTNWAEVKQNQMFLLCKSQWHYESGEEIGKEDFYKNYQACTTFVLNILEYGGFDFFRDVKDTFSFKVISVVEKMFDKIQKDGSAFPVDTVEKIIKARHEKKKQALKWGV